MMILVIRSNQCSATTGSNTQNLQLLPQPKLDRKTKIKHLVLYIYNILFNHTLRKKSPKNQNLFDFSTIMHGLKSKIKHYLLYLSLRKNIFLKNVGFYIISNLVLLPNYFCITKLKKRKHLHLTNWTIKSYQISQRNK